MAQQQLVEIDPLKATVPDENGNPTDRLRPGCTFMCDEHGQKHYYQIAPASPSASEEVKSAEIPAAHQPARKGSRGNAALFVVLGCVVAVFIISRLRSPAKFSSSSSPAQNSRAAYASSIASASSSSKSSALESKEIRFGATKLDVELFEDRLGAAWIKVVYEVTNTGNSNIYLSSGSYDIEDKEGNIVDTHTLVSEYPCVLAPGEKGHLFDCTLYDGSVDDEITVVPHVSAEAAKVELTRLGVSGESLSIGMYDSLEMHGRVTNTTDSLQDYIYVAVCLYDKKGKCMGVLFDLITTELQPGDSIGFEANCNGLSRDITPEVVDHYTIYAYPRSLQF